MSKPVKFSNNGGKMSLDYLEANSKFIRVNGQNQLEAKMSVALTDLDAPIQTKISSIDTIQTNLSTAQSNITNLQSNLNTSQTNITTLQSQLSVNGSALGTLQSTVSVLASSSSGADGVGISLDDAVVDMAFMASNSNDTFCKEWSDTNSGAGGNNLCAMCCSGTGQIILVPKYSVGNHRISTNYGKTWSNVSISASSAYRCSASLDGKYILVNDVAGGLQMSSNYGTSFSQVSGVSSVWDCVVSATGKYMLVVCNSNGCIRVSSDYGVNWSSNSSTVYKNACMAIDGSVMYIATDNAILKSVDYGVNWTQILNDGMKTINYMCCSSDGMHLLVSFSGTNQLLISHNFGANFSTVGSSASYYKLVMSSNGQRIVASTTDTSTLYYSIDGGNNWSQKTGMSSGSGALAMSYSGDMMYHCAPYQNVSYSNINSIVLNTSAPSRPASGSIYFNPSALTLNVFDGTYWTNVALSNPY